MKLNNQNLLLLVGLGVLGALYLKSKTDFDLQDNIDGAIDMIQELNPLASQLIIRVDRYLLTDTKTIGKMYLNNEYFCDTLEDTYRGQILPPEIKVNGATCIPNGTYTTKMRFSNKFQNYYPELLKVPYFTDILIHGGRSEKDTDGCILVGDYKNGVWYANNNYVQKLRGLIPEYTLCKTVVNIIK